MQKTVILKDPQGVLAQWLEIPWQGPQSQLVVTLQGTRRQIKKFQHTWGQKYAGNKH